MPIQVGFKHFSCGPYLLLLLSLLVLSMLHPITPLLSVGFPVPRVSSSSHQPPALNNLEKLDDLLVHANPNNVSIAKRNLVGKIIASKSLNRVAAKDIIAKAWASYENLQIIDLGSKIFLFTFAGESQSIDIIKKIQWFVMNHLMCLQFGIPEVSPHEIYFDIYPFWIG